MPRKIIPVTPIAKKKSTARPVIPAKKQSRPTIPVGPSSSVGDIGKRPTPSLGGSSGKKPSWLDQPRPQTPPQPPRRPTWLNEQYGNYNHLIG